MARVAVMVHTMAFLVTWKWAASVSTRKTTTKKSNASRVQPRKLAVTACHWSDFEGGTSCSGLEIEAVSFSSFLGTVTGEVYNEEIGFAPKTVRRRQRDEGGERKAYHKTGRKVRGRPHGCPHFLPSGQAPETPPPRR